MAPSRTCFQCDNPVPAGSADALCPRCVLVHAAAAASTDPGNPEPGALSPEEREFGDYELLEQIAHGGMGIVYKARQKSLDRIVALKLLLLGPLASADYLRRFRFEAVAAGSLRHPNIVQIHEVGLRDGQPFIVMEFVEGQNLARLVGNRPLPAKRAATYLKTIAEAIHAAHQSGILHRDLKPSNVMVDLLDQPRVTDFGLARRLEGDSELTLSGQTLGTPNYMPPEQAVSKRGQVGRASDVYGLGAIFYHLLTGRPPHAGESVAETIQQTLHAEPVRPRLLNPAVPVDAETICLKCLEKEPGKRYPTAAALAEDLGRFLAGEPIRARPLGALGRTWRWCRRKPQLAGALAALVLALTLGVAGIAWQARKATREAARAIRNAQEAERSLYAADMLVCSQALEIGDRGRVARLLAKHMPSGGAPDPRGWEWRYFWREVRSAELSLIARHSNAVDSVSFVGDGHHVLAGDWDGGFRCWNLDAPQGLTSELNGPPTRTIALSADRRRVAVVWPRPDPRVEIYSLPMLEPAGPAIRVPHHVRALAFDKSDSRLLLAADGWVGAFALSDGSVLWEQSTPPGSVGPWYSRPDNFSPDRRWLAIDVEEGGELQLWDLFEKRVVSRIPHRGKMTCITFSGDSRTVAIGDTSDWVNVWDVQSGRHVASLPAGGISWVTRIRFSPDDHWLASAAYDQTLRLWDTTTWGQVAALHGHGNEIWDVDYSKDGTRLVTGGKDRTVRLWPAVTVEEEQSRLPLDPGAAAFSLSSNGRFLVEITTNSVRLVETTHLRVVRTGILDHEVGSACAIADDGKSVLVTNASGTPEEFETDHWTRSRRYHSRASDACALAFSRDGQFVAVGDLDGRLGVWRRTDSSLLWRTNAHEGRISAMTFSLDSAVLATSSTDREAAVWEVASGDQRVRLIGHKAGVTGVQFSPDMARLVTSSTDGSTRVWSARTGKQLDIVRGQLTSSFDAAVGPDNRTLVIATGSGPFKVFDIGASQELAAIGGRDMDGGDLVRFVDADTAVGIVRTSQADRAYEVRVWRAAAASLIPDRWAPSEEY